MRLVRTIFFATAILGAIAPRANAALITFKYEGTVRAGGYDYSGIWGAANSSLAGLPITVLYYADTSRGTYFYSNLFSTQVEYRYDDASVPGRNDDAAGPVLSSSITIGSTTVSWIPNYFSRVFAEEVSPGPIFNLNGQSSISQSSDMHNGNLWAQLYSTIQLNNVSLPYGIDALGSAVLDPDTVIGTNGHASAWHYNDPNGQAIYDWDIPYDFISYSITATEAVPEPFTSALFGAGLAGILTVCRRRKQTQA